MKLRNIKLRSKLYILAFLLLSFTVFIGIFGVIQLKISNNEMKAMYEDNLCSIDWLNDNRNQSRAIEADLYYILLSIGDKEIQNKKFEDIQERNKKFDENINNLKGTNLDQYESDSLAAIEKSLLTYREAMVEIINLALDGKQKEALDKYKAIENVANDFQTNLKELAKYNINHAEEAKSASDLHFRASTTLSLAIIVIAAVLGLFISWFISKEISKPIMVAIRHIGEVADYNITNDMPSTYLNRKDEVGDLSKMVQKIEDNLRNLIRAIRDTSEQVAASSEELAATSHQAASAANEVARAIDEIAKGATEQAKSTTEGSDKLLQLGDLIEDDQHNIRVLEDSSNSVNHLVKDGLEVISLLSKKTSENEEASNNIYQSIIKTDVSSNKISEASGLIKAISEQTNLLSLNASIEAARAGEHGKGFAVVADEIRKLAEQSASSTKIIDEMVFNLQNDSKEAVEIMKRVMQIVEEQTIHVSSTEGKFHEILNAMECSVEAVNVIIKSASTMEKKKNEVMDTMNSLSAVAQENAAGAEEASASIEEQTSSMGEIADSSESLSVLAQELQDLISKFKM